MKKILLLVFIVSWSYSINAQCDSTLPVSEDFSNTNLINSCWNFIDDDGDGYNWHVNNFLISESYTGASGYLTPDNWAITYAIDLRSYSPSSTVMLSWSVRVPDWSFDVERYSVYAATGNQISDFTVSPVQVYENLDDTDASGAWGDRSLNISALAGNYVYIAFRHYASVFQDQINIDNMVISATLGADDFEIENFKHYYNPDNDVLTLKSSNMPISSVQIFNILGQQVLNKKLSQTNESIALNTIGDGIYIAQVKFDNLTKTIKFLKQ